MEEHKIMCPFKNILSVTILFQVGIDPLYFFIDFNEFVCV